MALAARVGLVELERLDRGDIALRPADVDLADVDLADVLCASLHEWRPRPSGERLVGDVPPRLPAQIDARQAMQAIGHLVENALRYTPAGRIVVRARSVDCNAAVTDLRERSGRASARVEVEDSGPGIPPEKQQQVCDKLYRGRNVANLNVARGSGIGLAVVSTLVQVQGGWVGLESTPGWGACFWIELPTAVSDGPLQLDQESAFVRR